MNSINKHVLKNGLQVFTYQIPNKKTISCGIWVNQGSKDEDRSSNGLSHIVEHLMFKIDSKQSTLSMAENMNILKNIGTYYNATTSKDHTSFFIEGLSCDVDKILEILSYLVVNKKRINSQILEGEKEIVLREAEEYLMSSAQIADRIGQALWGSKDFGQMVIGDIDSIKNFTCDMVDSLIEEAYTPDNCALVIVGDFDISYITKKINDYFMNWIGKKKKEKKYDLVINPTIFVDDRFEGKRSTIGLGFPGYANTDCRSQYIEILKNVFIMPNSKVLNELREKRGLVYSIKGFSNAFSYTGNFGISFSSNNEFIIDILQVCLQEFRNLIVNGVDEELLEVLKRRRQIEILYALETTTEQMKSIGDCAVNGYTFSLEKDLDAVRNINKKEMDEIIRQTIVTENLCMAILGTVNVNKIIPILKI